MIAWVVICISAVFIGVGRSSECVLDQRPPAPNNQMGFCKHYSRMTCCQKNNINAIEMMDYLNRTAYQLAILTYNDWSRYNNWEKCSASMVGLFCMFCDPDSGNFISGQVGSMIDWENISKEEFDSLPLNPVVCRNTINTLNDYCYFLPIVDFEQFLGPKFAISENNTGCFNLPNLDYILDTMEPLPELKDVPKPDYCFLQDEPQQEYSTLPVCNQYNNRSCCNSWSDEGSSYLVLLNHKLSYELNHLGYYWKDSKECFAALSGFGCMLCDPDSTSYIKGVFRSLIDFELDEIKVCASYCSTLDELCKNAPYTGFHESYCSFLFKSLKKWGLKTQFVIVNDKKPNCFDIEDLQELLVLMDPMLSILDQYRGGTDPAQSSSALISTLTISINDIEQE